MKLSDLFSGNVYPSLPLSRREQAIVDAGDAVAEWLELKFDEERRLRAVDRIRRSFLHPAPGGLQPIPVRAYWGLGWWTFAKPRWLSVGEYVRNNPAPFGWRWLKVEDRNEAVLLPLWLYWPAYVRRYWRSIVFDPLIALGLWVVEEPGNHYTEDGRPSLPFWFRRAWWCFLNDADEAPPVCWTCWRFSDDGEPRGFMWKCRACIARDDRWAAEERAMRAALRTRGWQV